MKDAVETTIADKYRALLFLMKNKNNLTCTYYYLICRITDPWSLKIDDKM